MRADYVTTKKTEKTKRASSILKNNLLKVGVPGSFFKSAILPSWWDKSCECDSGSLQYLMVRVMRFLKCSSTLARQCMEENVEGLNISTSSHVRLKKINNIKSGEHVQVTIRMCEELAAKLSRAFSEDVALCAAEEVVHKEVKETALTVRRAILDCSGASYVDLHSILRYCESRGIVVAHFKGVPQGKIDGAAINHPEHPVIILGSAKRAMWVPFHLAHELGHIELCHGSSYFCKVDGNNEDDLHEHEANQFARYLLLGEMNDESIPSLKDSPLIVRQHYILAGRANRVAPEIMALFAAYNGGGGSLYAYVQKVFTHTSKDVHESVNRQLKIRLEDLDIGESEKETIFQYLDYNGK